MMRVESRSEGRGRGIRGSRAGLLALALIVGSTVSDRAASFPGTVVPARTFGWVSSIPQFASLGILYGTVLSRMDPTLRESVVEAMRGAPRTCRLTRCAARREGVRKAPRCSRV